MDIGPSTTLAAAVDAHPALTRHFERLGLDYCCGGGRTIEEACRHRGLDTVDVLADLARHEVSPDPAEWTSMDAVLKHIAETRPGKAVVITDGYIDECDPDLLTAVRAQDIRAIISREGSPAELDRAGIPYSQLGRFANDPNS